MTEPPPDMDTMTDLQLGDVAAAVFRKGLSDGRLCSRPLPCDILMAFLPGYPHRIGHARKLRQVYGAGFDIAKMMLRVKAAATNQKPPPRFP